MTTYKERKIDIQSPLDIATLDIAAALPTATLSAMELGALSLATALAIATSTAVTEASRYIQCALY